MSRLKCSRSLPAANHNRRFKPSNDPNNTTWSRSATKYGQKILQSRGWTPGEVLGPRRAVYSDLRSVASGPHIHVALKNDTLGLGAKHDAAGLNNESTGLDVFQDLLGRLNGKSVLETNKDRTQRSTLRSSAYIKQRWGNLCFVSGGLLVGEKSMDPAKDEQNALSDSQQTAIFRSGYGKLPQADRPHEVWPDTSKRKKHKKRKTSGIDHSMKETSKEVDCSPRKAQPRKRPFVEPEAESHTWPGDMGDQIQLDKVRRHGGRAERKLNRKANRDGRHSSKVLEQSPRSSVLPSPDLLQVSGSDIKEVALAPRPLRETRTSQEIGAGGLSVRHRYIQQKKMCMMDDKALNEVLCNSVHFVGFRMADYSQILMIKS